MAKRTPDLFEQLRASGLRKRVARTVADAVEKTPGRRNQKPPKAVQDVIAQLRSTASDLEKRVTGRSSRSAAAKKGAATRRRQAAKRSTAAKKGARTRAKAR
jgi:hypothetical protein